MVYSKPVYDRIDYSEPIVGSHMASKRANKMEFHSMRGTVVAINQALPRDISKSEHIVSFAILLAIRSDGVARTQIAARSGDDAVFDGA